jgi:hypothetical protein
MALDPLSIATDGYLSKYLLPLNIAVRGYLSVYTIAVISVPPSGGGGGGGAEMAFEEEVESLQARIEREDVEILLIIQIFILKWDYQNILN